MRHLTVLLVEDNPRDVRLTQRAFEQAHIPHDLRVVYDGDEALQYLHGRVLTQFPTARRART